MSLPMPRFADDKDPSDVTDWAIDFAAELALSTPADTIASAVWTVPAGLTAGVQQVNGSVASVFLSGGTAGSDYVVACRITTAGGRTIERSARLFVRDR
jgi:hypothetical protein